MSLFACEKCGCVENTALSRYWFRFAQRTVAESGYRVGRDVFLK